VAELTFDVLSGPGQPVLLLVMLQGPDWVLSVRASAAELDGLRWLRQSAGAGYRALPIGSAAGARVHWAADGENATVMVGDDDTAWDFAVTIAMTDVDRIVSGAAWYRSPQFG
jgi:hypothetical protein